MIHKLKYFYLEEENIITLKKNKINTHFDLLKKNVQKVFYPDLIKYLKDNNNLYELNRRLQNILDKIESHKQVADKLFKEMTNYGPVNKDDILVDVEDTHELFFNKYCAKMKFKYTNNNILINKQIYTKEELFISRFIEQCGIKRYPSFYYDDHIKCGMYSNIDLLAGSLSDYVDMLSDLYKCIKIILDAIMNNNKTGLSLTEMKIIKFFIHFKTFFYLTRFNTEYTDLTYSVNSSPLNVKKQVDTAITNASRTVDLYFLKNITVCNTKYKSFVDKLKNITYDDRLGNTDFTEEFRLNIEMMCNEDTCLGEMYLFTSFQYILPMYMCNDLVNMIRTFGFYVLNYMVPTNNDLVQLAQLGGNINSYYNSYFTSAGLAYSGSRNIFTIKKGNRNICYFELDMLSIDYIDSVIDACLEQGHNYDMYIHGFGFELNNLFRILNI